jgi:hypothetical protein
MYARQLPPQARQLLIAHRLAADQGRLGLRLCCKSVVPDVCLSFRWFLLLLMICTTESRTPCLASMSLGQRLRRQIMPHNDFMLPFFKYKHLSQTSMTDSNETPISIGDTC